VGEQRRLGVLGQLEVILGAVPAQFGEAGIETVVDCLEDTRR
jgi:hypothetical protein